MIRKVLKWIAYHLPLRNVILFESCPDLADNTKPVFDEFVRRGINKKYKLIWVCSDPILDSYPKIKNVKYVPAQGNRLKHMILLFTARGVVCCNRIMGTKREDQKVFFIPHGTPIKICGSYYNLPKYVRWIINAGSGVNDISTLNIKGDVSKGVPLGYPRNDIFFQDKTIELDRYFGKFKKYLVWYPTVKQFKGGKKTGSTKPISLIDTDENMKRVNEKAKELGVLIIVKPHFAQMAELINKEKMSNIVFIDDSFFTKNGVTSYELLKATDGLISDYSSVYYDYLFANKPIGLVWDDVEDYKKDPGLIDNYEYYCKGGEKIYNERDFFEFLTRIADGVDLLKNEREEIKALCDDYQDGHATQRVADFILSQIN